MAGDAIDRKEFMTALGRACVGTCVCGAVLQVELALAAESGAPQENKPTPAPETRPGDKSPARAVKRLEFVDVWLPRFFSVIDRELDEPTRRRLMAANGKACFSAYRPDLKVRPEPATRADIAAWVAQRGTSRGYSMDGDSVILQYVTSAETGQSSSEGICLCPTAETQQAKVISPTFCWCSVGYVKEMHDRAFGRPVKVELIESVLMGRPRCRFRITAI